MRRTWLSPQALRLHATLILVAGGCLAFGWWMFERARSGDGVAWVYTFEWPAFAVYAVYMWWRLLHDATRSFPIAGGPDVTPSLPDRTVAEPASASLAERVDGLGFDPYDDEADPELAAYNRYLAALHETDRSRPWSRSGSRK